MNINRTVDKFLRDLQHLGLIISELHNVPLCEIQSKLSNTAAQNSWDAISMLKKNGFITESSMSLEKLKQMNIHPREYNDYWTVKWTEKGQAFLKEWEANQGSDS